MPIFTAISDGAISLTPAAQQVVEPLKPSIIGMSFLIQSFGMSMGSLVWIKTIFSDKKIPSDEACEFNTFITVIFTSVATAIPTLLLTQWLIQIEISQILFYFKIFSLILGSVLLLFAIQFDRFAPKEFRRTPSIFDYTAIICIGVIGGFATALFSVGIGEFLAVYLILRRFPISFAVSTAVIVSVICVLSGVSTHLISGPPIIYEILLWTIPGALIGGAVAQKIAYFLGAQKLKLFASIWIIISSVYLLVT